jgi:hypothetical protein
MCDICKKCFGDSGNLNNLCTHNVEQPFTCEVCKKSFNQSDKLKLHIQFIPGSVHLRVIYVRKHSLIAVTCRSICVFIEGRGHLRVIYVLNLSGSQLT